MVTYATVAEVQTHLNKMFESLKRTRTLTALDEERFRRIIFGPVNWIESSVLDDKASLSSLMAAKMRLAHLLMASAAVAADDIKVLFPPPIRYTSRILESRLIQYSIDDYRARYGMYSSETLESLLRLRGIRLSNELSEKVQHGITLREFLWEQPWALLYMW